MTTVTIANPPKAADWTRIAADAQHVEDYVNGTAPASLPLPGGGTRDNLAKVDEDIRAKFGALNLRGSWVTATAYARSDVYTYSGVSYITLTAHTSSTVAADLAAGRVGIYAGVLAVDLADPSPGKGIDLIPTSPRNFGTIASVRAHPAPTGPSPNILVQSGSTFGDKLGGHWAWNPASTVSDDGTVDTLAIKPSAVSGAGRYERTGLPVTTPAATLAALGLVNNLSPTVITAATTLSAFYLNKAIVIGDSATPVNFTVTLPSGAAVGSLIKIRISSTATKLYTINGGDVAIDGVANRVMWRGEAALLERTSTGWVKIGGRSIPFRQIARRTSNQSLTSTTINRVVFDTPAGDSSGLNLAWDATNARLVPPRVGYYRITLNAVVAANASITHVEFGIQQVQNDVTAAGFSNAPPSAFVDVSNVTAAGARICANISNDYSANAIGGWHASIRPNGAAGTLEYAAGIFETDISLTELVLW